MTGRKIGLLALVVLGILLVLPYLIPLPEGTDPAELVDNPDGRFIDVNGIRTYAEIQGPEDGTAIVLLHGLGGSTISWRDNIAPLAEAGYRVVAFDRPGFGLTDKPLDIDYGHPAQADFTAALMDILDIEQAVIVGHSAGGNVAAHFALRHPERVTDLVLVDAAILTGGPPGFIGALFNFPPLQRWLQVGVGFLLSGDRFANTLDSAYGSTDGAPPEAVVGYARLTETENWTTGFLGLVRDSGANRISDDDLQRIDAPTLIVWGAEDTWVPPENADQIDALLPNTTLISYPGIGHMTMEETPEQFNTDVLAFIGVE